MDENKLRNNNEHCGCRHDEEEHGSCGCEHGNDDRDSCGCRHEDEEHGSCGCEHGNDDRDSCGCEHGNDDRDSCGCRHDEDEHGSCGCGCEHTESEGGKKRDIIIFLTSLTSLIVGFILNLTLKPVGVQTLLDPSWVAIILCGAFILKEAYEGLEHKKINSSFLVAVALIAGVVAAFLSAFGVMKGEDGHSDSFLFASGEVVFLMFAGEMLEAYTVSRSHKRLASLLAKKPVTARLKTVNGYEIVPCETVKKGDILGVFTGDNVPTDGEIVSGSGVLNESTLTGEPLPRDKTVGDKVFAGTINTSSAFDFRATAESRDSVFSKITAFVGDAQKHRAPIEKTADKIAAYVVPSAIGVAAFTFIISLFALNATVTDAVSRALTVLIVACPCALTLATPAAISAAIGNASKSGVLVKNGKAFQVLSSVNTMFFDKTGTVTVGEPYLKSVVLHSAVSEPALLKYAASVESLSSHPLAKAVLDANEGGIYETKDFVSDGGKSLSGVVDGKNIRISKSEKALEAATASDVYIDNVLCGTLLFDDKIRPDAKEAIASLKALKITTAMLTGDNEAQANAVAAAVGIDKAYASLLPLDKAKILTDCAANNTVGKKPAVTMMLGDGVNDAPALSVASVAVSVGEFSSSVASEVADCCLLSPKLSAIPKLITLARRTQKTILFNIFFALSINVTAIILSILGLIEPVIGALLHNVSAIAIALSAAALGFGKKI